MYTIIIVFKSFVAVWEWESDDYDFLVTLLFSRGYGKISLDDYFERLFCNKTRVLKAVRYLSKKFSEKPVIFTARGSYTATASEENNLIQTSIFVIHHIIILTHVRENLTCVCIYTHTDTTSITCL